MPIDLNTRLGTLNGDGLKERVQDMRHGLHTARQTGQVRIWAFSAHALERARGALSNAPGPLARVTRGLRQRVDQTLEQVTRPSIPSYDELNVKQVDDAVRKLDLVALERVYRYEQAHKDRKTVLRAIERERERRLQPPEVEA